MERVCGSDGGQSPGPARLGADHRADGLATGNGGGRAALGCGAPFPATVERRALVFYRAILGGQGTAQTREDDSVVRCGVSEKTRGRLTTPNERRLAAEVLTCRVQHFTKGVILGSRAFMDGWFAEHRSIVTGRSRTERQRGSKPLGRPALRGLYTLRDPRC